MKILYVADRWDPRDHAQASGTDYEIYHALKREGAQVDVVGPFLPHFSPLEQALRVVHHRIFSTRLFKYPLNYFRQTARQVRQAAADWDPDLMVSMYAAPLVLVDNRIPLLYFCDSSIQWLKKQWKNHAALTYLTMQWWERRVIHKSAQIISFSESNARELRTGYGVPSDQVNVMTIPAAVPHDRVPETLSIRENLEPVRLLLVGRDYHRKGVDIALEVVNQLNLKDVPAELRVVGLDGEGTDYARFMGLYDKTIPEELTGYLDQYRWADFLIHPARFEAAGIVPSEAAAFGVPTLTNDVGGLATTVQDGVSGVVLTQGSSAGDYVREIRELIDSLDRYQRLCRTTRQRYEQELNWPAVGNRLMEIAQSAAEFGS